MPSMAAFGVNETGSSRPSYKWQRVLLKVSGEALAGDNMQNIDPKVRDVNDYVIMFLASFFLDADA